MADRQKIKLGYHYIRSQKVYDMSRCKSYHKMRTVYVKCTNATCNQGDDPCPKNYKIKTCQHIGPVHIYEDGEHNGNILN